MPAKPKPTPDERPGHRRLVALSNWGIAAEASDWMEERRGPGPQAASALRVVYS